MLASQDAIGKLAGRIERAYLRRHPSWKSAGLTPGAWDSAASRLLEAAEFEPSIPIDPEFFVAVQPVNRASQDPWSELTQERSLGRYLVALEWVVGRLRAELIREVRRAEKRLDRGVTLDRLVEVGAGGISPLALYILAHRAGRHDLSLALRADVAGQHRACPLYRSASRSLLPSHAYPQDAGGERAPAESERLAFSVN